jgi:hypothetical protein
MLVRHWPRLVVRGLPNIGVMPNEMRGTRSDCLHARRASRSSPCSAWRLVLASPPRGTHRCSPRCSRGFLAVREPDALIRIGRPISFPDYEELREGTATFAQLAGYIGRVA